MKACTKCGETKPLDSFGVQRDRKDGRTSACRDCRRAQSREWKAANPEKVRAENVRYLADNRERRNAYQREWNARNKAKVSAANRRWREANPDKWARAATASKARDRTSDVRDVTAKDFRRLLQDPCQQCDTTESLSIDHIIPLARGGRHAVGNLQILCIDCNQEKANRTMTEWRAARQRKEQSA